MTNWIERHASLFFGWFIGSLIWYLLVFVSGVPAGGC